MSALILSDDERWLIGLMWASDEAWGYRRKSVDMAIAASTPEADLFDLLETSPD